jgi:hypothetical protein
MLSDWPLSSLLLSAAIGVSLENRQVVYYAFGSLCLIWFFMRLCRTGNARIRVAFFFMLAIGGALLHHAGLLPSKNPYAKPLVPQAVKSGPSPKR